MYVFTMNEKQKTTTRHSCRIQSTFILVGLILMLAAPCLSFTSNQQSSRLQPRSTTFLYMTDDDKFSFGQRIESIKCVVVGALSGGIALAPFTALHDIALGPEFSNGVAQWEFDTDMGSLEAALFAIVYRYCIREDENIMLNQGVIGAFCVTRTLSRIRVSSYCTAAPLDCK